MDEMTLRNENKNQTNPERCYTQITSQTTLIFSFPLKMKLELSEKALVLWKDTETSVSRSMLREKASCLHPTFGKWMHIYVD